MVTHVNGFKLEVTVEDGAPLVVVSFGDGTVVLTTDKVSIVGLEKLPEVFGAAAKIAAREYENYVKRTYFSPTGKLQIPVAP